MEVVHLQRPFPAVTVEFLAHTLCASPRRPLVAALAFWPNLKHHDGAVLFARCARTCCLLACYFLAVCCLLAKLVRSTLDTKEGYKSKNCSTSSVTVTLSLPLTLTSTSMAGR